MRNKKYSRAEFQKEFRFFYTRLSYKNEVIMYNNKIYTYV